MDLSIIAIIIAITTIILSISATVVYSRKTISLQNEYNSKIDALNKTIDVNKSSTERTNSQIQDKINAYSLSFSTSNLLAPKISSENINSKNITSSNITSSNITGKSINGINAYFTGLLSTPLINSENITAAEISSSRLNSSMINTSTLVSSEITTSRLNTRDLNTSNINSKLVTSENFSGNLTGTQGTFSRISANNAIFSEASGTSGNFATLTGNQGTFTKISGNITTDEISDAPGGSILSINKNNQNVVGNDGVAIYNGAAIISGGGLSVGNSGKVPEGQVKIRDQLTIGTTVIKNNEASFGGPDLLSSLPASDGNTYIRPGKLSGSVYINDQGKDTYLGGTGSLYANNSIMFTNSSPMIQKQFNNAQNDRYGISLSNNAQRIYAGTKNPSSVNMSFANNDGSYNDIINVNNDGTTQVNGPLTMKNNAALSNNLLYLRSYGDSNNILAYANNNASFGVNKSFSNQNVPIDGPVLAGNTGGVLGTRNGGDKSILTWDAKNGQNNVNVNGALTSTGMLKSLNTINTPMLVTENAFVNQNLQIQQDFQIGGRIFTNDGTLKVCDTSGNNCKSVVLQ